MTEEKKRNQRFTAIILCYPVALILIALVINWFAFGIDKVVVALPATDIICALAIAGVLLAINHSWLMTSTELTRLKYKIYATPEEWAASGTVKEDASKEGLNELERRHNAHRNTTENTVYFVFLAAILSLVSPSVLAAQIWIIGFAVARLGYTFSYLAGRDDARGLFMSLSLTAIYGMASYLAIGVLL